MAKTAGEVHRTQDIANRRSPARRREEKQTATVFISIENIVWESGSSLKKKKWKKMREGEDRSTTQVIDSVGRSVRLFSGVAVPRETYLWH